MVGEAILTVAVSLGLICRVKVEVTEELFASVTVIVSTVDAIVTVGVPEIAPVDALRVNPAGSAGVIVKTFDPIPPADVTGVKAGTAVPTIANLEATAVVAESGGSAIAQLPAPSGIQFC